MSVILGIGGRRRNAAAAVCCDGRLLAACEQERIVRVRSVGLENGKLPAESIESVLSIAGRAAADVTGYAVAEDDIEVPPGVPVARLDHHFAHAALAFLGSPANEATILICDRHSNPELTVWRGEGCRIVAEDWPWDGPAFASVYSRVAGILGFEPDADEHRLESLARMTDGAQVDRAASLLSYADGRLRVDPRFGDGLADWAQSDGSQNALMHASEIASSLQRRLGDLLVEMLEDVRGRTGGAQLCLGGGFFFNTYFNTRVEESGLFERTFVPANPGNSGLAAGAALAVSAADHPQRPCGAGSPFLGPEYSDEHVKGVLDNCKLTYEFAQDGHLFAKTAEALAAGQLVGWFQGRMEWGPRALGNRSILASPTSPYVLDNLNLFLKQRERYRSYGVAACEEDVGPYFEGPTASPFMQFEYRVKDADLFRGLMPFGCSRLRVQTVGAEPDRFRHLLKVFGEATGVPVLVNTSFNGFHEPIVCTPRDAVRVFYGTGLDMLVIGNFIVRK